MKLSKLQKIVKSFAVYSMEDYDEMDLGDRFSMILEIRGVYHEWQEFDREMEFFNSVDVAKNQLSMTETEFQNWVDEQMCNVYRYVVEDNLCECHVGEKEQDFLDNEADALYSYYKDNLYETQ